MPFSPTFNLTSRLVLICLVLISKSHGQKLPDQISFERISIPGTIRSSQVVDIIQDKHGLIWLGGHGLFSYDGFGFRQYKALANQSGLLDPYDLNYLMEDTVGNRLLLATHRFGIVQYRYATDELTRLPVEGNVPVINLLAQTADGRIWAASFNAGLFYLENDTLRKFAIQPLLHPSSFAVIGNTLYVGGLGQIVVIGGRGVKEAISLPYEEKGVSKRAIVTTLYADRDGLLWIGTDGHGVLTYDLATHNFTRHFPATVAPFFSRISRITQDREGLMWILTKANGLAVYDPMSDKMLHVVKDRYSANSISSDNCFSIMEDREGIVWIGTTGDLNKFDRRQIKFDHLHHNPLDSMSLSDNMVRGMFEDVDGRIWAGTDAGYVNVIDFNKRSVQHHKIDLPGDSQNYVPLYFSTYDANTLLVATSAGVLQWDRRTKRFSPFQPLWSFSQGKSVRQVLRKGNSLFYIYSGSFYITDLPSGRTSYFPTAGDSAAVNITAIFLDDKQRLWLGSSRGISLMNESDRTFRFFRFPDLPRNTEGPFLLVLSIDQIENELFIGTFNAGIFRMNLAAADSGDVLFRHYTDRNGLPSNTIYSSLADHRGNIWHSTNNGIVKFEPEKDQFIAFAISEGLQNEEFNRLAYVKTRDGKLMFGGINGINIVDPERIVLSSQHYLPKVLNVTVQNAVDKGSPLLKYSGAELPDLNYKQNFISFQFFVPHYATPRRYSLYYRLNGLEKEWKEVTRENVASYVNLQPGKYTFEIRTVANNGAEAVTAVPFTIMPPYWKTWWFIVLAFLVVAFLVMTIIRSYIRKAQHDRLRLQELLRIRTFEIEKSREELQILNEKKDLIFSILSHDLRSPLTTLKGFLGYIIDHAHDLTRDDLKRHAVNIKNSVTNSLDLIDNTLFWSLSQMGNIQYTPTHFSLRHLVDKLRGLYQLTADKKRIPLTVSCEEEIILHGDENMIYVTLRNLVSNALKFTAEGNPVTLDCVRNNTFVEIIVKDKGIGMSAEYLNRILSMQQPIVKKGTSNEKGTGLGLLLCKKFVEMHNGHLIIESIEHEGTTFTVRLPLAVKEPATAVQTVPGQL